MLSRFFAVMLAILIANPICCCQDISSMWSSADADAVMSCGCQPSSEDHAPSDEPCSTCSSTVHKVSAETSLELPSIQVNDLESQSSEFVACRAVPRDSQMAVLSRTSRATFKQTPLRMAYCVYLL